MDLLLCPASTDRYPAAASPASVDTVVQRGLFTEDPFDQDPLCLSQPSESSQLEQPETPIDLTHPSPSHVPTALLIDLDP